MSFEKWDQQTFCECLSQHRWTDWQENCKLNSNWLRYFKPEHILRPRHWGAMRPEPRSLRFAPQSGTLWRCARCLSTLIRTVPGFLRVKSADCGWVVWIFWLSVWSWKGCLIASWPGRSSQANIVFVDWLCVSRKLLLSWTDLALGHHFHLTCLLWVCQIVMVSLLIAVLHQSEWAITLVSCQNIRGIPPPTFMPAHWQINIHIIQGYFLVSFSAHSKCTPVAVMSVGFVKTPNIPPISLNCPLYLHRLLRMYLSQTEVCYHTLYILTNRGSPTQLHWPIISVVEVISVMPCVIIWWSHHLTCLNESP